MRQARGWMMMVALCCAAGMADGAELPDARLQEAQTALDEANTSWEAGRYADAIARGERALALREAVLGSTHPEVARCLEMLGRHLLLQGNVARAEPLLQRARDIAEVALGEDHPVVAQTLNDLANLYAAQELYERAEPLYERALAIREKTLGRHHPEVAQTLNDLADLHVLQQYDFHRAKPRYERALAIREKVLGKHHPEVAQTLNALANLCQMYAVKARCRARPLFERALAIREAALGKNHPSVAESLEDLSGYYEVLGPHERAGPLRQRALAIREAALEKPPPDIAMSLLRVASLYYLSYQYESNRYARATALIQRALVIREETLGKDHLLVASVLEFLAGLYSEQGLYGQAEPLHERVLAIREATLGGNHPHVASSLVKLANLYSEQGLYGQAEPFLQRALAIQEAAFGEQHPSTLSSLTQLANHYKAQGLYVRAAPLFERALTIAEAVSGKNSGDFNAVLAQLASLYVAQGLYLRAEPILKRRLALWEARVGKKHLFVLLALNELADLYVAQGLYDRAVPLYERALRIQEATVGKSHPRLARMLNNLGLVRLAQQRPADALPLFTRAFAMAEERLRQEALGFSEERLASFLQFLRTDEERLYALLRAHPGDAGVRRLALSATLLLKGRSVEETANISRTIYRSLSPQDHATFDRLRALRTQWAQLSFQGPGLVSPPAHRQRLKELSEQGAALEADLAKRSAPLRALAGRPSSAAIVDRVAAVMPKDGALVEFIAYVDRPLVPEPGVPQRPASQRYLALVLFPDATTRALDLGPAEPIDAAASHLRSALANRDAAFQAPAQTLYQLAFEPLLPLLGDTQRLFLSLDGQLALVPFAALHDGRQFLVETFDFTYLSSGKDLLPHPQDGAPPGSVVVLADPDFGAFVPVPPYFQEDAPVPPVRATTRERFSSMLRADLARRAWALTPLPGSRREAKAIQRLLPQAQLFLGADATKERLLHLPTPGVLHLATHGFFLEDGPGPSAARAVGQIAALGEAPLAPSPPEPLLRSGLVLAGARALAPPVAGPAPPPPDSTLVTALELAGLNLWGTQLAVLSACDTGRGDVKLGQGVYGLRRALLVAGAETVVMSLWKVNDEATRELMEAYYHHLLKGQGRVTALREAMQPLRQTQPHPHSWAPYIEMGRDMPLRLPPPTPR